MLPGVRLSVCAASALVAVLPASSVRAGTTSPFSGTWVDDLATQSPAPHTDVYVVRHGMYACRSCSTPRAYAADGRKHAIAGDPEVQFEATEVISPRAIRTTLYEPTRVRVTTMTVSADDRSAIYVTDDDWPGVRSPLRTVYLAKRVAAGPEGAHGSRDPGGASAMSRSQFFIAPRSFATTVAG